MCIYIYIYSIKGGLKENWSEVSEKLTYNVHWPAVECNQHFQAIHQLETFMRDLTLDGSIQFKVSVYCVVSRRIISGAGEVGSGTSTAKSINVGKGVSAAGQC